MLLSHTTAGYKVNLPDTVVQSAGIEMHFMITQILFGWGGEGDVSKKAVLELVIVNRMIFDHFVRDMAESQLRLISSCLNCLSIVCLCVFHSSLLLRGRPLCDKHHFCTATSRCNGQLPPVASCKAT